MKNRILQENFNYDEMMVKLVFYEKTLIMAFNGKKMFSFLKYSANG